MVARKKAPKMKRTQISLSKDEYDAVRRIAARRNVSMSGVVRSAIKRELETEQAVHERMLSIIGLGEGSDPRGSENHDERIYE